MENKSTLMILSQKFALNSLVLNEKLLMDKRYSLANQFCRSSTSIGANIFEAQYAESSKDFIHKLKIAEKEASETAYWLSLFESAYQYREVNQLKIELAIIRRMLTKVITTMKTKNNS
jgi:four helix bundle protein